MTAHSLRTRLALVLGDEALDSNRLASSVVPGENLHPAHDVVSFGTSKDNKDAVH